MIVIIFLVVKKRAQYFILFHFPGTFIVIDAQLKRIAAQGDVDVYNYVMDLRAQRNLMVQVEEQYILIHDVLVEAIACGNTEIQARDLRSKIRELMKPNVQSGK